MQKKTDYSIGFCTHDTNNFILTALNDSDSFFMVINGASAWEIYDKFPKLFPLEHCNIDNLDFVFINEYFEEKRSNYKTEGGE